MTLQKLDPSHQAAIDGYTGCALPKFDYLGPDIVPAWTDPRNIGVLCERCQAEPWDDWDNPDFVAQKACDGQRVKYGYFRDFSSEDSSCKSSYNSDLDLPSGVDGHGNRDGDRPWSGGSSSRESNESNRVGFSRLSWTRCDRKYVWPETVERYGLPWMLEPDDLRYIIIKAWIPGDFQEELARHTRRLKKKEGTLSGSSRRGQRRRSRSPRTGSLVATTFDDGRRSANSWRESPGLTYFNTEDRFGDSLGYPPIELTESNDRLHSEVLEASSLASSLELGEIFNGPVRRYSPALPESELGSGFSDTWARPTMPTLPSANPDQFGSYIEGQASIFWNKYNGPTVTEVRDAVHRGCHLCTLILTTWLVGRSNKLFGRQAASFLAPELGDQRYQNRRLSLEMRHRYLSGQAVGCSPTSLKMRFGFGLLDGSDLDGKSTALDLKEEVPATAPAEVIANYKLRNCLANHGSTCGADLDPFLPSRVINVRGRDQSNEPFLLESDGKRGKYATLSYCWGQCRALRTTTETILQHCQCIPLHTLPKTMRDAINITLALGLDYLWIDTLYIIQDCKEDVQQEIGSMAEIYSESTVTIAAIGAVSADSGFPLSRNKLAMIDCQLSPNIVISAEVERQDNEIVAGTLHKRAWCFQEVQLAPRILSCRGKELYFQCREGTYREGSPSKVFKIKNSGHRRRYDSLTLNPAAAYSSWIQCVEAYCDRKLTFPNDKLNAISALSARFPSLFEDDAERPTPEHYLAGLWKGDLLKGLTWRGRKESASDIPYRAPSWSWVASDKKISWPGNLRGSWLVEILEASINTVSDLVPYGLVRSGKIVLYGPVTALPADAYKVALQKQQRKTLVLSIDAVDSGYIDPAEDYKDLAVYVAADKITGELPKETRIEMIS